MIEVREAMARSALLLAGMALGALVLTEPANAAGSKSRVRRAKPAVAAPAAVPDPPPPQAVLRVAEWVAGAKDNRALPYIIVDKQSSQLFVFNGRGVPRGQAPVLIGMAAGDEATPGVGGKTLSQIGPAERTTPAGRFLARFGVAAGNQRVLWVDYATSVALHPLVTGTPKERRRERLLSPTPDDNRITFGCINVPPAFYRGTVSPLFRGKGGYVYILPDTKPMEEVFPRLRVEPFIDRAAPTES
jgi:hypothetical protein